MEEERLLKSYLQKDDNNKLSKGFTKVLLSIIFLLSSLIFTSIKDDYLVLYKKYVFEESFNFMDFKNFYETFFTSNAKKNEDVMVFGSTLEYSSISPYQNGQKLVIGTDQPINALAGGIVVFSGEKEGFNNTVIIQGSDGYDIWYGNLSSVDIKLYDYIDKEKIIALASDNLYLQIIKDGKYYTYEEYQNQV